MKNNIIQSEMDVKGSKINVVRVDGYEYISLTDLAKTQNDEAPADVVKNWLRNKETISFLGVWEELNNENFRNTITHLQLVDKDDIKRFKNLNIIAAVQPYWHLKGPKWWEEVDYKLLGERAIEEYPLNSFIKENVIITSSSDHSVTPVPNPFYAIEAGVTRNLYNHNYFCVEDIKDMDDERYLLNKAERATVKDLVRSFTINGAYQIFREKEIGSLEVGKYADFIIIDRDIFNINPIDIENTKVLQTFFNGKLVYDIKQK